jgi:hypothetical protein
MVAGYGQALIHVRLAYLSFCVGAMYSAEYDACDVTLSGYPHRASLKDMPDHGGKRTYDLGNTSPKVVGSIPPVARHIFQAWPVWILHSE